MSTVLVVGGSGNAGRAIADLLVRHSEHEVRLAGRSLARAKAAEAALAANLALEASARISATSVDATSPSELRAALEGIDLCVMAASVSGPAVVSAVLGGGVDHLGIQLDARTSAHLLACDDAAREAGVTLVTDGGLHPGVPAAMVRYALGRLPQLQTALVGSCIAVDWAGLAPFSASTMSEFVAEFRGYRLEEYRAGVWRRARRQEVFDFSRPFGRRRAAAMGLAEMHQLVAAEPGLLETGFYVGGFNPVVDFGILPLAWVGAKLDSPRVDAALGRIMDWGLRRFSRPPFGTVLQLEGRLPGQPRRRIMRLRHPDAYVMTAAPAAAAAIQILDGTARRPGAHTQAMLVEPTAFFAALARMGVEVSWFEQGTPEPGR